MINYTADKDLLVFIFKIHVLTLKLTYEKGAKIQDDVIGKHRNHVFVLKWQYKLYRCEFVNFDNIIVYQKP